MILGNYAITNYTLGRENGGVTDPFKWYKGGSVMNFYCGDYSVSGQTEKSSFPDGYRPPAAWILAPKAGGLSSHNQARITFSEESTAVAGKNASGEATITISPVGTAGLIVSASATATITFSSSATLLSVAAASGSATITLAPSALLGALAGLTGSTSITLTPSATSYAVGYMSGLSTNETEFSASALASAVWDALTADYQVPGSFGEAMAAAGSAGDPWSTNIPGSYVAGQAGYIVGNQVLTEADITKIADIVLRRATSNIEASSDGDALSLRSLYGMIAQGVHKTQISGASLTVTQSDDATVLGTRTITTDPASQPIVGLDTD